jgi:hypothetical protein
MIPVLINAIKDLNKEVTDLEMLIKKSSKK